MILVGPDHGRKEATSLFIDMESQPTQSMTFNTQSIYVATMTSQSEITGLAQQFPLDHYSPR